MYIVYFIFILHHPNVVRCHHHRRRIDKGGSGALRIDAIQLQGRRAWGKRYNRRGGGLIQGRRAMGKRDAIGAAAADRYECATEATRGCTIDTAEGRYKGCVQRGRCDRRGANQYEWARA